MTEKQEEAGADTVLTTHSENENIAEHPISLDTGQRTVGWRPRRYLSNDFGGALCSYLLVQAGQKGFRDLAQQHAYHCADANYASWKRGRSVFR